jgi:hypothetical protein
MHPKLNTNFRLLFRWREPVPPKLWHQSTKHWHQSTKHCYQSTKHCCLATKHAVTFHKSNLNVFHRQNLKSHMIYYHFLPTQIISSCRSQKNIFYRISNIILETSAINRKQPSILCANHVKAMRRPVKPYNNYTLWSGKKLKNVSAQ